MLSFRADAAISLATLVAIVGAAKASAVLPNDRAARLLAGAVRKMESRDLNWSNNTTAGYYEELLKGGGRFTWGNKLVNRWWEPKRQSKAAAPPVDPYARGGFRIYDYKPNLNLLDAFEGQVVTNSFGMIGRERALAKPPHTVRIALLGDSVTRGMGIPIGSGFDTLLESRLNQTPGAEKFEVLNFGVSGYRLSQVMDVAAARAPAFQPDLYLLVLTDVMMFRAWDHHIAYLVANGMDLKYDCLRAVVREAGVTRRDDDETIHAKLAAFRLDAMRRMLSEIRSGTDRARVPLIAVLMPEADEPGLLKRRFAGIRELLDGLRIPTIDMLDTFDGVLRLEDVRVSWTDLHPNRLGHRMIFEKLYRRLLAQPVWTACCGRNT